MEPDEKFRNPSSTPRKTSPWPSLIGEKVGEKTHSGWAQWPINPEPLRSKSVDFEPPKRKNYRLVAYHEISNALIEVIGIRPEREALYQEFANRYKKFIDHISCLGLNLQTYILLGKSGNSVLKSLAEMNESEDLEHRRKIYSYLIRGLEILLQDFEEADRFISRLEKKLMT